MGKKQQLSSKSASENKTGSVQPKTPRACVDFSQFGTTNATLQKIKDVLLDIAGPLPLNVTDDRQRPRFELLCGKIAEYAGFTTSGWSENNISIDKLTYHIAFRTPFQVINGSTNANLFKSLDSNNNGEWFSKANEIRLVNWFANQYQPRVKRLYYTGELELYDPAMLYSLPLQFLFENKEDHTQAKYEMLGVNNKSLEESGYFDHGDYNPRLEHYLITAAENGYFSSWATVRTTTPIFPYENYWPIAIVPSRFVITLDQQNLGPEKFYTPLVGNDVSAKDSGRVARVINAITVGQVCNITIQAFEIVKVDVSVPGKVYNNGAYFQFLNLASNRTVMTKGEPFMTGELYMQTNGETDQSNILRQQNNNSVSFFPDYFMGEYVASTKFADQQLKVKVLKPTTYTASIPVVTLNNANLTASKLFGCRVLRISNQFMLEYTNNASTSNTVMQQPASGLTFGFGIDVGAGIMRRIGNDDSRLYRTANSNGKITLNDYLSFICPLSWKNTAIFGPMINSTLSNPTISPQREIVFGITGKTGTEARDYYIKHRDLFEALDMDQGFGHFRTGLLFTGAFMDESYFIEDYGGNEAEYNFASPVLNKLKKDGGLVTEPNVIEKYVVLSEKWHGGNISGLKAFADAINQHDLAKLTEVYKKYGHGSGDSTGLMIRKILESQAVKDYYQTVHFNS